MTDSVSFQRGTLGRVAIVRLRPNQDLVSGVEAAVAESGFSHAIVLSAVGSLVDASLLYGAGDERKRQRVAGPGVEILTLAGEVRPDATGRLLADLRGTIADSQARVYGGQFEADENPICITLELVLQEWRPD